MPIIFGGILRNHLESFERCLKLLKKNSDHLNFTYHQIEWFNFKGGLLLDLHSPYKSSNFFISSDDIFILTSGFIYNKNILSGHLQHANKNLSDSEFILRAYKRWGIDFIKKINGDFAIYIMDKCKNKTYIIKDRLGIHPLNYAIKNDNFYFSSDGLALCKSLFKNDGLNKDYKIYWLYAPFGQYNNLPCSKAKKLKPAHHLLISDNKITEKKYWHPEQIRTDNCLSIAEVKHKTSELLKDAVKIRSDKKYKASAHVSGGLDSGTVASLARKEYAHQKKFFGFSWSPENETTTQHQVDERNLVKETCEYSDINRFPYTIGFDDYNEFQKDWRVSSLLYDEVKTRKDAQKLGINLIFSGWGGDEFISINQTGIDSDLFFNYQWYSFFKKNKTFNPIQIGRILWYKVLNPKFFKKFYKNPKDGLNIKTYFNLDENQKIIVKDKILSYKSRNDFHLKLLYNYHLAMRTEDWMLNGYRKGIEYRYPLLDYRIIEYMLKVPSKLLFKDGHTRIVLREISKNIIPESVRWHNSKFDEIKFSSEKKLLDDYAVYIMNNSKEMISNPALDFIDFELLFTHAREELKKPNAKYASNPVHFITFIHKFHEFTKGYYA